MTQRFRQPSHVLLSGYSVRHRIAYRLSVALGDDCRRNNIQPIRQLMLTFIALIRINRCAA